MYTIAIDDLYQLVIVPFANTSELLTYRFYIAP